MTRVREIVQANSGTQLASDNGVFRFREEAGAEEAAKAIKEELNRRTFVTGNILVISYDLTPDLKPVVSNDRFDQQHGGNEESTNNLLASCILGPATRLLYRPV